VLFAPFEKLPHEGSLFDLDGLAVLVHFDQEHVVRVVLGVNTAVHEGFVQVEHQGHALVTGVPRGNGFLGAVEQLDLGDGLDELQRFIEVFVLLQSALNQSVSFPVEHLILCSHKRVFAAAFVFIFGI